jgi:hypothetical protein
MKQAGTLWSAVLAVLTLSTAGHAADLISPAKAIELALHRLEFLVALPESNPKSVPKEYMERLHAIRIETLPPGGDGDPAFRVELAQPSPLQPAEAVRRIEIPLDAQGKASKFKHVIHAGGEPASAPSWPEKDATSLAENALHFVLDNAPVKPDVAPYERAMTRLKLHAGKDAAGKLLAVVEMETLATEPLLRVRLRPDGTFQDYEIVPRPAALAQVKPTYDSIRQAIFVPRCVQCHDAGKEAEDVRLIPYELLMSSPRELVLPGNADESRLWVSVNRKDKKRMPPPGEGDPLSDEELIAIRTWIDQGAKGPETGR